MRAGLRCLLLALALFASAALPAAGQTGAVQGWGLRAGVADDPDQVVGGFHLSFGDLVPRLRFQPSLELGSGDETSVLTLTLPGHYRVPVGGALEPYFGGALLLSSIDRDRPPGASEDDFDIGVALVGGLELSRAGDHGFLLEVHLGGGKAYDAKVVVGVTF